MLDRDYDSVRLGEGFRLKRVTPLMNRVAKTPATTAPTKIVGALFVCVIRNATQIPGNTA